MICLMACMPLCNAIHSARQQAPWTKSTCRHKVFCLGGTWCRPAVPVDSIPWAYTTVQHADCSTRRPCRQWHRTVEGTYSTTCRHLAKWQSCVPASCLPALRLRPSEGGTWSIWSSTPHSHMEPRCHRMHMRRCSCLVTAGCTVGQWNWLG